MEKTLKKPLPVERHTSKHNKAKINQSTQFNLISVDHHPDLIRQRLINLEREWDIERYLETNASIFILIGLILSVTVSFYWLFFTVLIPLFLLQHSIQGWCPPLTLFRWMGKRTKREIENERHSLKIIRGDFSKLTDPIAILRETSRLEG